MTKLFIQIDDIGTSREMTEEELAEYEAIIAGTTDLPSLE